MTTPLHEKHIEAIQGVEPDLDEAGVLEPLEDFTVQVLGPQKEIHPDDRAVIWGLENLLPRMFPKVGWMSSGRPPDQLPSLHRARIHQERISDPDLSIVVGPNAPGPRGPALFVGSEGWMSYLSREAVFSRMRQKVTNPISALHSAALAAGEAFKEAYCDYLSGIEPIDGTLRYDLLRFKETSEPVYEPAIPQPLHISQALLVGAGAIGQAFVSALNLLPELAGSIRIVDHDASDDGNAQRSMLANFENSGVPKVKLCRQLLQSRHGLLDVGTPTSADEVITDYEGYRSLTGGRIDEPLVVTAVDSAQARRDVQAGLPKVVLDGWTEVQRDLLGYGVGRFTAGGPHGCSSCVHRPSEDDPKEADLAAAVTPFFKDECQRRLDNPGIPTIRKELMRIAEHSGRRFEEMAHLEGAPLGEVLHAQDCGLARVPLGEDDVRAPVTHMPVLAGTMLAAQFVVELMGRQDETSLEHLAWFDARKIPGGEHLSERDPWDDCICQMEPFSSTYRESWGQTIQEVKNK